MAEDDAKGSGRSRFKSKWGKILKQSDELKSFGDSWSSKKGKNANSQEEVDDFLKPSIERAATNRPRLDVSIAQRWPDPNDVRQAAGEFPLDATQNVNGWRKRRRREGLTVRFVKTVPETIGHGGDETLDPPSDVARLKARNLSAAVNSRPAGPGDRANLPMPNLSDEPRRQPPTKVVDQFDDRMVPNHELSHPHWNEEPSPPRIGISRAPTGFNTLNKSETPEDENVPEPTLPNIQPHMDSRLATQPEEQDGDGRLKVSPTPRNPHTLVARKQNDMRANEGMALRRASAMIEPIDVEDDGELDLGLYAAATATYRAEAAATPPIHGSDGPPVIPSIDATSPMSDTVPDSPSPFTDSKYLKRHSREVPLVQPHEQQEEIVSPGPPQGARSPFADPKYLNSRSRDPSPSKPPRRADDDQVATVHIADEASQQYQDLLPKYNPLASPPLGVDHGMAGSQHTHFDNLALRGPREAPGTLQKPTLPDVKLRPEQRTFAVPEQPQHTRTERSVSHENAPPSYGRPMPAPHLNTEPQDRSHGLDPSTLRDRIFDPQAIATPLAASNSPNGPRPIMQGYQSSSGGHSRTNSYNKSSPQSIPSQSEDAGPGLSSHVFSSNATSRPSLPDVAASLKSAAYLGPRPYESRQNGHSSQLAPPEASPYGRRPSTNDYFELGRQQSQQPAKSPLNSSLRPHDASRPGSAHSNRSFLPTQLLPQDPPSEHSAADTAFEDFASRVAHMKGVFRLTAEKEEPAERCTPSMWLRTAYWWYLRGKLGLETLLRQRAKSRETDHRELLTQPHVDLAKSSWILSDPLENIQQSMQQGVQQSNIIAILLRDVRILKDSLKSLSHSMLKANIMPPPQSLIQGQDTQIWLEYPQFTPDLVVVLGGAGGQQNETSRMPAASDVLPLGDTEDQHCYSRFLVNVFMNTEDASTDRVSVACTLTVLRGKREYQSTIVIASQSELVNLKVAPRQSNPDALNWQDVSWKASSLSITINLPRGIHANIRLFEQDFKALWNLVEYSRRVDHSLRPEEDEVFVHEMPLMEVQYADSSNPNAFPQDKVKHCRMLVWERLERFQNMGAMRKRHRGFHVLVVTDPTHKTLSYFSHRICANGPLFFEFITDAAAHGTTAMVIKLREESRQCRMLLVFPDAESRQALYNKLNGIDVRSDETIVGKMSLTGLSVEALDENANAALSGKGEFSYLQWQRLGVTNDFIENANSRLPNTVESESLRIIARHGHGCITDRLNLDKGELLLRFPCTNSPTVQMLRQPQVDMTMSIDARNAPPKASDSVADVFKVVQNHHTIRTLTFATPNDLHAFETAITGLTVLYDGLASTLGISRRMMVVPIYHKWTASNVRIQILANAQSTVFQLIAFMEDFAHADALCFQIKSTDVFETIKGDAKGKKWTVKMVDAKFSLPPAALGKEGDERPAEERAKRRFVNLEGLDYAQEHDDITVGFESQDGMF